MEKRCLPENDAVECLLLFQKKLVPNVGNTYVYMALTAILVSILKYWTQSSFFLFFEKPEEDIFAILLFFIDLFTTF